MNDNQNRCPKCGGEGIEWDTPQVFNEFGLYNMTCENCGFEGKQYFELVFTGWEDMNDNELPEWKEV